MLYGIVKSKSIRKKQVFANTYYVLHLLISCKQAHINNSFKSANSKINYNKITIGWEYYDPVYIYENKMRTNVVRMLTESRLQNLARIVIGCEPSTYSTEFNDSILAEYKGKY